MKRTGDGQITRAVITGGVALLFFSSFCVAAQKKNPDAMPQNFNPGSDRTVSWRSMSPDAVRHSGKATLLFVYDSARKNNNAAWKLLRLLKNADVRKALADMNRVRIGWNSRKRPVMPPTWPPAALAPARNGAYFCLFSCDLRPLIQVNGNTLRISNRTAAALHVGFLRQIAQVKSVNARVKAEVAKKLALEEAARKKKEAAEAAEAARREGKQKKEEEEKPVEKPAFDLTAGDEKKKKKQKNEGFNPLDE